MLTVQCREDLDVHARHSKIKKFPYNQAKIDILQSIGLDKLKSVKQRIEYSGKVNI